ncbi:MAG: DNA polymerase IV [Kiritimatiellae bacterium]|nr:DNA polymerase IV [Kiritimatiellia bacterium]
MMERAILHIDMDAFFASVEQQDHPQWRGKPVIVGALPGQRGVVSTCSYEARGFGVHSAMPSAKAVMCCPEGIFVKPRMTRYVEVSRAVFAIFSTYTPLVEGLSVDEAFLDVSHVQRLFGTPREIAQTIKRRIREELGLTCSVGIARNKSLAKIASEERKPDGLFEVPEDQVAMLSWLGKKPLRVLWGVGPKCAEVLERHSLKTVRDLQAVELKRLEEWLTPALAAHLHTLAFGKDARPLVMHQPDKSYSREHTYPEDILDRETMRYDLLHIAQDVGRRLREAGLWAKTGRLKIRYTGFRTVTRQVTFPWPLCDDFALRDAAWKLLDAYLEPEIPVRLIGFGVEHLTDSPSPYDADDLFATLSGEAHPRQRQETISKTMDQLRKRYGNAIRDASSVIPKAQDDK